ncbi:hypothetical protein AHF37_07880 [Paragonimus kellicotti]|nr:hypothetical protein AHF37_07880 [Paragonimus kellicotti]
MSNLVTGDRKNFLNLAKQWFQMERISPLRLHEENRILGGFSLKQLLFSRTQLTPGSTSPNLAVDFVRETWTELTRLVNSKSITPLVDSEWSFEDVKDAMMRLQERRNVGKVVLLPKATPKEVSYSNCTPDCGLTRTAYCLSLIRSLELAIVSCSF